MALYKVRSGQNIFDVALSLHGSVEGIFDLLISNSWLTMETPLTYGMLLKYHEEFVINPDIATWLENNNVLVKNGEHIYYHFDIERYIEEHIRTHHKDIYDSLSGLSSDEQNMFWETLVMPRMIIHQHGRTSDLTIKLRSGRHLIIDWGDYSAPQIIEEDNEMTVEHCYKSDGVHIVTLFGDFEFEKLDFRNLNGIYYPLSPVYADEFFTILKQNDINKLIITQ